MDQKGTLEQFHKFCSRFVARKRSQRSQEIHFPFVLFILHFVGTTHFAGDFQDRGCVEDQPQHAASRESKEVRESCVWPGALRLEAAQ